MKKPALAVCLALSALASACATQEAQVANDEVVNREYPTGSNIPRKQGSAPQTGVTTVDQSAIESVTRQQPASPATRGGGR